MPQDPFEPVRARVDGPALSEALYLSGRASGRGPSFLLRHDLRVPRDRSAPPVVELTLALWDGPGLGATVVRQELPFQTFSTHADRLHLAGNGCLLTPTEAVGACHDGAHRASWSLHVVAAQPSLRHLPREGLYRRRLLPTKVLTAAPLLRIDGELRLDGSEIPVQGWLGARGHAWGLERVQRYAYARTRVDDGERLLMVDGFSASLRWGSLATPLLSVAMLRLGEREVAFNAPHTWWNRSATVEFPRWRATFQGRGVRLATEWALDPADVAGLAVRRPDGRHVYRAYSPYAHALLVLTEDGQGRRLETDAAELEFLTPEPLPGLRYLGDPAAITAPPAT